MASGGDKGSALGVIAREGPRRGLESVVSIGKRNKTIYATETLTLLEGLEPAEAGLVKLREGRPMFSSGGGGGERAIVEIRDAMCVMEDGTSLRRDGQV